MKEKDTFNDQTIRALKQTINVLSQAIEKRDPYATGHQQRVAKLARAIAKEMNFADERILGLEIAALSHDIGKMYIPAEILSKPFHLTKIEFAMITIHPQLGHDILKNIELPWPSATIILQHHEKMNGSGYPQGLVGDEILLEARILVVADVVEAMTSHRPYRPPYGTEMALEEITHKKGRDFDSEIADLCLKLFAEKKFMF